MSLNVSRALREGIQWMVSKHGAGFVVAFFIISTIGNIGFDSATVALFELAEEIEAEPIAPLPEGAAPLALDLPGSLILLLILVWVIGWIATSVITVRIMAKPRTDPATADDAVDRLTIATINELIARIIIFILVGFGLILLIVPGVFLAIVFYFARPLIAIDDRNFVDAMAESWELSKGNRFDVFILLIGAIVIYGLIIFPGIIGTVALGAVPILAAAFHMSLSAIATVFWLSVVARAYVQIVESIETDDQPLPEDAEEWDDPQSVDWS